MRTPLEPLPLEFDAIGRPFSRRYGDVYASRDGASGQARHVFLGGNELPARWARRQQFVIVETGFGLGNNFLQTWQAWRDDPQRCQRLHYVAVELHPVQAQDMADTRLSAQESEPIRALRRALAARWPLALPGLHRIEWEQGQVVLTLALGAAMDVVPKLTLGADAFYLDGFAPDRNPQMWEPQLFRALARLARPGATAATYSCAAAVREALTSNGFEVALWPGYASKREMIAARYAPRWKMRRHEPPAAYSGEAHAIVIGAGLAGCATSYALRRRGWCVTHLEQLGDLALGASALPAGLLHPLLSADDNLASRLSRAGFCYSLAQLQHLAQPTSGLWAACGVFQQAEDHPHAIALRAYLERHAVPQAYAGFLEPEAAARFLGVRPRQAGIWFPAAGIVNAQQWCRSLIAASMAPGALPGNAGTLHPGEHAVSIVATSTGWRVHSARASTFEAPVLVLANALGAKGLVPETSLPLQAIAGRVSLLRAPALAQLRAGISGAGYLLPPLLGSAAVGATYETCEGGADPKLGKDAVEAQAHAQNLQRLAQMLEPAPAASPSGVFSGQRCVSQDRLPLAGALPDEVAIASDAFRGKGAQLADLPRRRGLYCLTALGSRGLSLGPVLGEHLACCITGEPSPLETALAKAVDPARFTLQKLR